MKLSKILNWINDGKIYALVTAITVYLLSKGWIGQDEVILIGALASILFGVASYEVEIDKLEMKLGAKHK